MNSRTFVGQALVARGHHGEHDGDGAAQAAPHQDRLVSLVDGLHEMGLLQHRQHAEHHERARQQGADRHGGDAPDIEPGDLQQHVGRQHRGQHEDQAVRPELELGPQLAQRRPLARVQMGGAVGRDGEGGDHHRDDAGDVPVTVGHQEAEIGQADRDRGDGGVGFAQPRQQQHGDTRHEEAADQAADEFAQEHQDRAGRIGGERDLRRIGREARDQDAQEQAEGGDGDGVVQQRLALGQDGQPLGRADVAEDADDRGRIGGRHHGAQQQADDEVHPGRQMHDAAHDGDAHQHGHDGHQQHGPHLVEQAAHVDGEAGGEEQGRQEQRQEHLAADLELVEADEGVAQRAEPDLARDDPRAEEAQAHAGDGQQDGVRHAQALGQRHQQAHHRQHHGDREQGVDRIGHLMNLLRLKPLS